MFIEVCFPKDNEAQLLEISKKLDIRELMFIYPNKKKTYDSYAKRGVGVLYGFFEKKQGVFEEIALFGSEKRFWYLKDLKTPITQVHIKELTAHSFPLILQVGSLKNQKKPELITKLSFIIRLCKKYGVRIIGCSCCTDPKDLITEKVSKSLIRGL